MNLAKPGKRPGENHLFWTMARMSSKDRSREPSQTLCCPALGDGLLPPDLTKPVSALKSYTW